MKNRLSLRALNRATLARQHLLKRSKQHGPLEMIEQLAGMQAQVAWPPFVGLWSRLESFDRASLLTLLHARKVVRATAMRGTLHYLSAKDYSALRPPLQPGLTKGMLSILRDRLKGADLDEVFTRARAFFAKPQPFDALRDHLAAWFPKQDERALAYAARLHLPLIQLPDDSRWGYPPASDFGLGPRFGKDDAPHALVRRYLAAFGPATAADFQTWSGLPAMKPVFEAMRDELTVLEDEDGRTLFDLPDAPRPGEDAAAPVRFVPDFDNLVLGHADRRRVISDAHRKALVKGNLYVVGTWLIDGFAAGAWKIERTAKRSTLTLDPWAKLSVKDRKLLEQEAMRLLAFTEEPGKQLAFAVK